jgi:hypothetical protein
VLQAPPAWQAAAAGVVALIGTLVLHWAFPMVIPAVGAAVPVAALFWAQSSATQNPPPPQTPQVTVPARCPHTQDPMALVQVKDPVPQVHPSSITGLGVAHIDNVIALNGSSRVQKFETVCLTVSQYPTNGRQLWLVLRLKSPNNKGGYDNLFYVVGALSDPSPGRYYSVAVDRHCSSQSAGDRHTLFVMSAPASSAAGLWENYNARLSSLNSDCNTAYDGQRHRLPDDYDIVSEQGDVIQH